MFRKILSDRRYPVKKRSLLSVMILAALLAITASSFTARDASASDKVGASKLPVFVSILPQKFFAERIGKDLVDVQVMVQPGASPHTYEPKPQQMAALSKARIYYAIGVPFEDIWLPRISTSNPGLKVVHTDEGIEKLSMTGHHHHDEGEDEEDHHADGEDSHHDDKKEAMHKEHDADQDGDHDHEHEGEPDPHIWLSPKLAIRQAEIMLQTMKSVDPENSAIYDENCRTLLNEIGSLDKDLSAMFAERKGMAFMVFHPSWGYFAHDYNLVQMPVEIEGKSPKPAQLKELIELAREKKISIIFAQPQFSTKSADLIAKEIGGEVIFADPLAYNWIENMRNVAARFKAALK